MTKPKKTLDEILNHLMQYSYDYGTGEIPMSENPPLVEVRKAKQAITSLIKELAAEAKPGYKPISKYAASVYYQGFNQAVDEFEQNLLKALEEVVKTIQLVDELSEYALANLNRNRPLDVAVEQLIYAYHDGGYDGHGVAIYHDSKGQWHLDEINHCSCNGALDEGFNKIGYTKGQLIELLKKRASEDRKKDDYEAVLKALEEV